MRPHMLTAQAPDRPGRYRLAFLALGADGPGHLAGAFLFASAADQVFSNLGIRVFTESQACGADGE